VPHQHDTIYNIAYGGAALLILRRSALPELADELSAAGMQDIAPEYPVEAVSVQNLVAVIAWIKDL
jgi:hypothetical protein